MQLPTKILDLSFASKMRKKPLLSCVCVLHRVHSTSQLISFAVQRLFCLKIFYNVLSILSEIVTFQFIYPLAVSCVEDNSLTVL